ncbi:TPA: dihydrofolate reductase family protein, partial [Enterococcus faecium]|nr:dihydrofolate reductase family protein [Enterococcus faecium]
MRKIIFYGAISLDGYLATKTDDLQWLFDTPTGKQTTYEAFYETIDTSIMGRKTYQ